MQTTLSSAVESYLRAKALSRGTRNEYFATQSMIRPRGWDEPVPVGRYWRAALVVFFNYGVDTGTVWKSAPFHEPILWRHVSWDRHSPDREVKEKSRWGWLFYRRVRAGEELERTVTVVGRAPLLVP